MMFKIGVALAVGLGLAAPAAAQSSPAGEKAMIAAGKIMFDQRCHICHSPDPASASYGPTLKGVIGRKAGSVPGFAYSDAMKAANIVWTEAAVRAWMADNTGIMPGTKMRHVGVTDPIEQDFIIAYLKTLSPGN